MGKVERFEDLIAWQKARELTKQIYFLTMKGPFSKDYGLRDQIRRAFVSVMSNLAEGFDRSGRTEFHQFVVIAKGSCAEVRSQMYVALDVESEITVNKRISHVKLCIADEPCRGCFDTKKASFNFSRPAIVIAF